MAKDSRGNQDVNHGAKLSKKIFHLMFATTLYPACKN
jgi:hypothetical protein